MTEWPCALITLFFVVFITGCSDSREMSGVSIEKSETFTEFATLRRPDSPNTYLIVAAGQGLSAMSDATAPMLNVSADRLATAWVEIVRGRPRTRVLGVSDDGLQIEAEQRSALFGFIDRISFRAVPLAPEQSTFFAYSRSQTGYWDFGVNCSRLREWVSELTVTIDKATAVK